ncbi:MAG: class I SAM-dependent methyltransferase [Candidatus Eremiobacteraeota bacterium]|nr:class I SAM-dependent methyltransferase [Candidatus Eremiobacteraeota bacterium]
MDLEALRAHYDLLAASEPKGSAVAVGWKTDEVSQRNNASIAGVFDRERAPFGIYEIGCGNGRFLDFLKAHYPTAQYRGCDISERMVEATRERHPDAEIEVRDVLARPLADQSTDYVVASGVFNLRMDVTPGRWWEYVQRLLESMYRSARKGIAANFLSDQTDWRREWGYYQSPSAVLDFARENLSRFVEMHHEFYPWEFALYVYRAPQSLRHGPPPVEWPPSSRERQDSSKF